MAQTFEVKTRSGSRVMAKIAGTESTANTMSESSSNEERDEQRRRVQPAGQADEERLAVQVRRHRAARAGPAG